MDNNTIPVWSAESYVGRNSDRDRVYVRAEIMRETARPGQKDTEHRPVDGHYLSLHLTGTVKRYRSAHVTGAGQVTDDLADIAEPAPGWTLDELVQLLDIWQHWHLNDLQAGCSAMPRDWSPGYPSAPVTTWPTCPVRDYRWGSAWLVKRVPDEIVARLRALFDGKQEV